MSKLDNFHLQIVSKYINNYDDFKNLLNLHKKLNELYFSTFNIINISYNYIVLNKQIEKIINNIIDKLPNVSEIVLSFYNQYHKFVMYEDFVKYILCNYNKFDDYLIKHNLKNRIKIKLKLNFRIKFITTKLYNDYNFGVCIISEMIKKNIIINQISILLYRSDVDIDDIYLIVNKYINSKLRFILYIDNDEWKNLNEKYKNIGGFMYSFTFEGDFCFNNDETYLNDIFVFLDILYQYY